MADYIYQQNILNCTMINFVFDFHFTEPWINSMDHDVITSEMLEQSTNNQFVNEEISEAYKNFN